MTKKVTVEIVDIASSRSDFGEGDLEVYGHLGTWKIARDFGGNPVNRGFWLGFNQQNDGGAVNVPVGGPSHKINVTSPVFFIEADEELWVGGHLKEDDSPPNNNDSLGDRHHMIKHDDITTRFHTVRFFESDQIADATFKVNVL